MYSILNNEPRYIQDKILKFVCYVDLTAFPKRMNIKIKRYGREYVVELTYEKTQKIMVMWTAIIDDRLPMFKDVFYREFENGQVLVKEVKFIFPVFLEPICIKEIKDKKYDWVLDTKVAIMF